MLKQDKLLELADFIEKMPQGKYGVKSGFEMRTWSLDWCLNGRREDCGTVSCIGGSAQLLWRLEDQVDVYTTLSDDPEMLVMFDEDTAEEDLVEHVDYNTLDALFYPGYEPAWNATPHEAARVIRYLVETGKVDWTIIEKMEVEPEIVPGAGTYEGPNGPDEAPPPLEHEHSRLDDDGNPYGT